VLAGLIVLTGSGAPLRIVGEAFEPFAVPIGVIVFAGLLGLIYRASARASGTANS
jgi:hypothetical protein